jgi:acyl carrier protein
VTDAPITAHPPDSATSGAPTLPDLAALLARATGGDRAWAAAISAGSRLEADLGIDSLELTSLNALLRARYGDRVDLPGCLAGLELDGLVGLTVGDLLDHVATRTADGLP